MLILLGLLAPLVFVVVFVVPSLAKQAAKKAQQWVLDGRNPWLRHHIVKFISLIPLLCIACWLFIISFHYESIEVNGPFDKLSNQVFFALLIVSAVASIVLAILVVNHLLGIIRAYLRPNNTASPLSYISYQKKEEQ